jgi:hypothetical protein
MTEPIGIDRDSRAAAPSILASIRQTTTPAPAQRWRLSAFLLL